MKQMHLLPPCGWGVGVNWLLGGSKKAPGPTPPPTPSQVHLDSLAPGTCSRVHADGGGRVRVLAGADVSAALEATGSLVAVDCGTRFEDQSAASAAASGGGGGSTGRGTQVARGRLSVAVVGTDESSTANGMSSGKARAIRMIG